MKNIHLILLSLLISTLFSCNNKDTQVESGFTIGETFHPTSFAYVVDNGRNKNERFNVDLLLSSNELDFSLDSIYEAKSIIHFGLKASSPGTLQTGRYTFKSGPNNNPRSPTNKEFSTTLEELTIDYVEIGRDVLLGKLDGEFTWTDFADHYIEVKEGNIMVTQNGSKYTIIYELIPSNDGHPIIGAYIGTLLHMDGW